MSSSALVVESAHHVPLVWLQIAAAGGAAADPVGYEGLYRHMMALSRRGAGERDRATLNAAVDDLGASLGVVVRRDWVGLYGVCLARHIDKLVGLATDVLSRPQLTCAEHDRLLDDSRAALDELRDDDAELATRFFTRDYYPGHPYARTALGTASSLDAIDLARVRDAHRQTFVRSNLVTAFAGHIDPDHAHRLDERIRDAVRDAPAPALPDLATPAPSHPGRRCLLIDKPDRAQAQVIIGHPSPQYGTPEFEALQLVNTVFGGTFTSRLMQEVRAKRGWSYDAGSSLGRARGQQQFRMSLAPSSEVAPDAIALVLELFETLVRDGIDAGELAFAKSYATGSLSFAVATAQQRMNITVRNRIFGIADDYRSTTPERVERVTVESARAATQACLHPDHALTVVVATANEMLPRLASCGVGPVEVIPFDSY